MEQLNIQNDKYDGNKGYTSNYNPYNTKILSILNVVWDGDGWKARNMVGGDIFDTLQFTWSLRREHEKIAKHDLSNKPVMKGRLVALVL